MQISQYLPLDLLLKHLAYLDVEINEFLCFSPHSTSVKKMDPSV
jgi:hypothetical protein